MSGKVTPSVALMLRTRRVAGQAQTWPAAAGPRLSGAARCWDAVNASAQPARSLIQLARSQNEILNPVTGLPAPLRVLCRLTRGNRVLCAMRGPSRLSPRLGRAAAVVGCGHPQGCRARWMTCSTTTCSVTTRRADEVACWVTTEVAARSGNPRRGPSAGRTERWAGAEGDNGSPKVLTAIVRDHRPLRPLGAHPEVGADGTPGPGEVAAEIARRRILIRVRLPEEGPRS